MPLRAAATLDSLPLASLSADGRDLKQHTTQLVQQTWADISGFAVLSSISSLPPGATTDPPCGQLELGVIKGHALALCRHTEQAHDLISRFLYWALH